MARNKTPYNSSRFFNFTSSFWDMADQYTRTMLSNFWEGLHFIGESMNDKAIRFKNAIAPEYVDTDTAIDYFEIPVGFLESIPIKLDPTEKESSHIITPKGYVQPNPSIVDNASVHNDLIEINPSDYYDIRNIAVGMYVVVSVDRNDVADRFYKIKETKSSEEVFGSDRYYNSSKADLDDRSGYKYMVELEDADLSYIGEDNFKFYITTGRAYVIDKNILSIPILRTAIGTVEKEADDIGVTFVEGIDYTLNNSIIEFTDSILDMAQISNGDTLYCELADIIEHNMFDMYGKMIKVPDWWRYGYDRISAKAAVSGFLKSLQNPSTIDEYERALNLYYGLPIAPQKCEVVGLYESFGYEVVEEFGSTVRIKLRFDSELHNFIQVDTEFFTNNDQYGKVDAVNLRTELWQGINTATIDVSAVAPSSLTFKVGDTFNVRLPNNFPLKSIQAEDEVAGQPGHVIIDTSSVGAYGSSLMLQHLIDITNQSTDTEGWPEILIHGTSNSSVNYDGIYHITAAVDSGGDVRLDIYDPESDEEPKYNDYIHTTATDIEIGHVHIIWPTHKYLLLTLEDATLYKAYMDAPIDTIYDKNDRLTKYSVLCRCVSVVNSNIFPGWNEFDRFRKYNGIDKDSHILEAVDVASNAVFGDYFPADYEPVKQRYTLTVNVIDIIEQGASPGANSVIITPLQYSYKEGDDITVVKDPSSIDNIAYWIDDFGIVSTGTDTVNIVGIDRDVTLSVYFTNP